MVHQVSDGELMELVVRPASKRIFHEGELDHVTIIRPRTGHNLVEAVFTVRDETFSVYVRQPGIEISVEDQVEQTVSDLQDHVAESSFAWGELRGK